MPSFVERLKWIESVALAGPPGCAMAVAVRINAHLNGETNKCWLLLETLATECKVSRSAVKRALTWLKGLGFLVVVHRHNQSSVFRLRRQRDGESIIEPTPVHNRTPVSPEMDF